MKNLTEIEKKNKIIEYLKKKGFDFILNDSNRLFWQYKQHYSSYTVELYFSGDIIKYYVSKNLRGIGRRRTSTNNNTCCLKIYKDLVWIKEELNKCANETKKSIDTKNFYCTELERYYKRTYSTVSISAYDYGNSVSIGVYCKNDKSSFSISITVKNNKHYLESLQEDFIKKPTFDVN